MADWPCARCQAAVSPGAPRCPVCPSTSFEEDVVSLKISRDGTVSDSAAVALRAANPALGVRVRPEVVAEAAEAEPEPPAVPEPEPEPVVPPRRTPPRMPPGSDG